MNRRDQHGLTLTELLITMLLSGVLSSALYSFLVFTTQTYRAGETSLHSQRESARIAEEIASVIREAASVSLTTDTITALASDGTTVSFEVNDQGRIVRTEDPPDDTPDEAILFADSRVTPTLSFEQVTDDSAGALVITGVTMTVTLTPPNTGPDLADTVSTVLTASVRASPTSLP